MSSWEEDHAMEMAAKVPLSQQAMGARAMPYLDGLNPAQREAVETMDGPVLMLAGAGTGKTKALTARIVHLINMNRAGPNEILAVTFTNKAAFEMKMRVGSMLGEMAEGMRWMGTFHSLCVKILRRHAELVGLKSNFTILDTDDQIRLLKQLIRAENIDEKRWPPRLLLGLIDAWKNKALTPDRVSAGEDGFNGRGVELYAQYQARLKTLNAADFGDLLLHVVHIFQTHADVLEKYQRWFKYILVDEYQDTNVAQYMWLRLLAQGHKNICCVGDDDQSIYGWRGAEVGNILRFEKDFEGATVIKLEQNYRSTPHILGAASSIIAGNSDRLGKTLWTASKGGEKVNLIGHWDGEEEARWIGEKIEDLNSGRSPEARRRDNPRSESFQQKLDYDAKHGLGRVTRQQFVKNAFESGSAYNDFKVQKLLRRLLKDEPSAANMYKSILASPVDKFNCNEMAILVRASHQMRAFEDRFLTIGLPYRVIGGPRFYERMEIRDAMAYFRVAASPDDSLAFERIVNTPKRGLGDKAIQTINATARQHGVSMLDAARIVVSDGGIATKGRNALGKLIEGFDRWSTLLNGAGAPRFGDSEILEEFGDAPALVNHVEIAQVILDESGYTAHWQNDKTPEGPGRLENLKELVKALEEFENIQGFLEHVSLIMENDNDDATEKVSIMTLHGSKGLEFPVVFLPGWEEGLFPSQRSMDESGQRGLEEERRLAYVGITRAEELCTISFAANRRIFGQWQSSMPSRFIDELPADHVDVLTPPGLYGGGGGAASSYGMESDLPARAAAADAYNSPGWKRMQARTSQRGLSEPAVRKSVVIDARVLATYSIADRVMHSKFGIGTVIGIEADKLSIVFDAGGAKKVVASFVTPADDVPF